MTVQKVGYDLAVNVLMLICRYRPYSGDMDYVPVSQEIRFNSTLARQCLDITVISDEILEFNEMLLVNLEVSNSNVVLQNQTAIIVIEDDDSKLHGLYES